MIDKDLIQKRKEWIARRTAQVDQLEKHYEEQYPFFPPQVNKARMERIEVKRFYIDIHRWELEQQINDNNEEGDEFPE